MHTIQEQDQVQIAVTGTLDNGAVFMENGADDPLVITVGSGDLPPSVEARLIGKSIGDTVKARVSPDEGFGPRLKDLLHKIPRSHFQETTTPKPGMLISQKVTKDGVEHTVPATVLEVDESTVLVDYNHPLAGHHLSYTVNIMAIETPRS
jgi:FKBP-type peptidyl-prolyl cis-trans isomerase 2